MNYGAFPEGQVPSCSCRLFFRIAFPQRNGPVSARHNRKAHCMAEVFAANPDKHA